MTSFEIGKTYATRSLCDWDCIYRFIVTARSAKSVTIQSVGGPDRKPYGETTRRKLFESDGAEWVYPQGQYSMAPIIRANKGDIA